MSDVAKGADPPAKGSELQGWVRLPSWGERLAPGAAASVHLRSLEGALPVEDDWYSVDPSVRKDEGPGEEAAAPR